MYLPTVTGYTKFDYVLYVHYVPTFTTTDNVHFITYTRILTRAGQHLSTVDAITLVCSYFFDMHLCCNKSIHHIFDTSYY